MVKFFKKILVSLLGRDFILIKFLSILKNSFTTFKTSSKINLKHGFMLIPKIISSQYIFEFQKNSQLNELKNNYNFNYKDWSSAKTRGMWRKSLSKINNIKYLEIGCFEGRSAMFIGEQENTKEIINKNVPTNRFFGKPDNNTNQSNNTNTTLFNFVVSCMAVSLLVRRFWS